MPRKPRFELYQDTADEWRWRLVATNGNIIADSGEGYTSKQGAKRGIQSVKKSASNAQVIESDQS
ncbi:HVO_2922 family protein [Haladaptatus caseinilyticus]|uniref:HVO_2922 family protein n=1 Tax=Haladaptatus caseinilyticus TaxID=2993314 RepID=UPI00224AD8FD|nr:HVO_2922 family protein [Haladaptatus caseinilyticus]